LQTLDMGRQFLLVGHAGEVRRMSEDEALAGSGGVLSIGEGTRVAESGESVVQVREFQGQAGADRVGRAAGTDGPRRAVHQATKGKYATVEAADYERLAKYKWYAGKVEDGRTYYAYRCDHGKAITMHREIMKPPPGMVVDPINGDGICNRQCNLRVCTQLPNCQNGHRRSTKPRKSQSRGVFPRGSKWQACLFYNGKYYYLGLFDTEVEAAMARDRKTLEMGGEYAQLNFPREVLEARWPDLRRANPAPSQERRAGTSERKVK
jgi:hypothetical protein